MKKAAIFTLSLMLILTLVIAGCSNNNANNAGTENDSANTTNNGADNTADNTADNAPPADTAGPNDTAFTIRLSAWFIDDRTFMQDFKANVEAKYKEKYPNATVQWDILLGATYFDKLKAELASKTAADVIVHQGTLAPFVEAGYLSDLSDQPWVERLSPGTKPATTVDGKVYGTTLGLGGSGVWYNKQMFSDMGLSVPKNWAEFITLLDTIKAAGKTPIGVGFKDTWTASLFLDQLGSGALYGQDLEIGKKLYDGDVKVNGPELQSVMSKFEELTQKGFFNKTALSIDWPQSADLFTSGESAMIVQGSWMPGAAEDNFTKKGHTKFDVGYFQVPDENGFYNISVGANESISVNADSKLQQESKDLISAIMDEAVLGPFDVGNGSLPPFEGMKVTYPNTGMNEFLDYVANGSTKYSFLNYLSTSAGTSLIETVTKIVSGAKFDPSDLKDAQSKMDKDKATIILPPE